MVRLRIVGVVVAVTTSSCSGPALIADSSANTFADSTAEGPGSGTTTTLTTADATAPSGELTGDPSSAAETNGCGAASWDDGRWDEACWQ